MRKTWAVDGRFVFHQFLEKINAFRKFRMMRLRIRIVFLTVIRNGHRVEVAVRWLNGGKRLLSVDCFTGHRSSVDVL